MSKAIVIFSFFIGMYLHATDQIEILNNKRSLIHFDQGQALGSKRQKNNEPLQKEESTVPLLSAPYFNSNVHHDNIKRRPRIIDLFCGAGGTSEGFRQAGFDIICGIDCNKVAIETFKANFPHAYTVAEDIYKINPEDILNKLHLKSGELEILVASPSCKKYSSANNRNNIIINDAEKKDLDAFHHEPLLKNIQVLRPKWFFLENVKKYQMVIETHLCPGLKNLGYKVKFDIFDASNYSVPQKRKRIIMIATTSKEVIRWPLPNYKPVSVKETLQDMEEAEIDVIKPHHKKALRSTSNFTYHWQSSEYQQEYEKKHAPIIKEIRNNIKNGGRNFVMNERHRQRYIILPPKEPARTITCSPQDISSYDGGLIHYKFNRPFTPREVARIQTFPDDYKFEGTCRQIYKLIGNAVPPLLSKQFALIIYEALSADQPVNGTA